MTTTLGDILLVLLGGRPGSAHELHQRQAEALGARHQVDLKRVAAALSRHERLGNVVAEAALSRGSRRVWTLTDAGRRRQRSWLLDIGPDHAADDVVVRVLLAIAATDRATCETVIGSYVAALESRPPPVPPERPGLITAAGARWEYEEATARATLDWLHRLLDRIRDHSLTNLLSGQRRGIEKSAAR